jgi:hypothetical protein
LILAADPDAAVVLSYQIRTYKVGNRHLYVGTWKHGLSIYGWEQGRARGFVARHPALKTSKWTIQLPPADAADISDEELSDLVRGPGRLIRTRPSALPRAAGRRAIDTGVLSRRAVLVRARATLPIRDCELGMTDSCTGSPRSFWATAPEAL